MSCRRSLMSFGFSLRKALFNGKIVKQNVPSQTNQFVPFACNSRSYCTQQDESAQLEETDKNKIPTVDVETSIRYMKSKSYQMTYGGAKVWQPYRRNHKGHIPPEKTRRTCIAGGKMRSGNPCALCRDDHLVLHPKNSELLSQFISPKTGEVLDMKVTNLCRNKHKRLHIAIQQAWDLGTVKKDLKLKTFDYAQYYPELRGEKDESS